MWANAQRDGRPAEYRWRPLFNAAKYGWRPLLMYRAITLPRCETRWNLQGSSNYSPTDLSHYQAEVHHIVRTCGGDIAVYHFFRLSIHTLVVKIWADKIVRWCPDGDFFWPFLGPAFLASRAQHISGVHSKFALRPHHVSRYRRHPICGRWD